MKNANQPAMPITYKTEYQCQDIGVTKREHFAAMAMQGILSNGMMIDSSDKDTQQFMAQASVRMADSLLKELELTQ